MKVIVGLGNPGPKYVGTRHNIGWEVIDYLAAAPGADSPRRKFDSLVIETREGSEPVLLVKPETFMNLSGRAVRGVIDFYKLDVTDVLIVCDDFNLPLGKLRVRSKGSHGGQNGLRNIQACLGTEEYVRLRVGVGTPGPGEAIDFVLTRFKPSERPKMDIAVEKAGQAAMTFIRQGLEPCMNLANGPEPKAKPKPKKKPEPKIDEPSETNDNRGS